MPARNNYEDWDSYSADEDFLLYVPPEYRNIGATQRKATVQRLWEQYCNAELILQPDFQRHYVWDNTRASRYIESLLLLLPTPPIFLSEEQDDKFTIIDGHQRLESLFRYMQPLLSGPAKFRNVIIPYGSLAPLRLTSLEVMSELNGSLITALPIDDRKKLWDTTLTIIVLPKTAHPDMKYVLFARLNQGSMTLNSQELRNCLYRGPYNDLIARLSEEQTFLGLWGRSNPDKRMRHRELVLRFFALLHRRNLYRRPFKAFLNDEMVSAREIPPQDIQKYRHQFETATSWVSRIFGNETFRQFQVGSVNNPSGQWGSRKYDLIYEIEMVGFAQVGDSLEEIWNSLNPHQREIFRMILRNRFIDVMTTDRFLDSINQGTTRPEAVNARFEPWLQVLQASVSNHASLLKDGEELERHLKETSICTICPYPVMPDDAAWVNINNGKRIAHRYCSKARSLVSGLG